MLSRVLSLLIALILLNGCAFVPFTDSRTPPELLGAANLLSKGKTAEAAAQLDAVIRSRPHDQANYLRIADLCARKGNGELAARYAEQGIAETAQDDTRGRAELLVVANMGYELAGDNANAIRTAKEANRLLPDDPTTLNALGYAYAQAGQNLDDALKLTTRAVERARQSNASDQALGLIIDSLGWTYFKMGNSEEAVRYLASAADLAPGEWEIHDHLSQVYTAAGNTKDAGIERDRAARIRESQRLKDG